MLISLNSQTKTNMNSKETVFINFNHFPFKNLIKGYEFCFKIKAFTAFLGFTFIIKSIFQGTTFNNVEILVSWTQHPFTGRFARNRIACFTYTCICIIF